MVLDSTFSFKHLLFLNFFQTSNCLGVTETNSREKKDFRRFKGPLSVLKRVELKLKLERK